MHRDGGKRRAPVYAKVCPLLPYDRVGGVCAACGTELVGRQRRWCSPACQAVFQNNHYWQFARAAALKRDSHGCVRCGTMFIAAPEVNHKVPRYGRGYGVGCHHHQSNLESLCHYHHVKVTRAQRIARARSRGRRAVEGVDRAARH